MKNNFKFWKLTGIVVACLLILSVLFYVSRIDDTFGPKKETPANFVGSKKCQPCHEEEYNQWKGSDHDNAMDPASEETVLGDFNDAIFEDGGIQSRFYRKDGKFFVYTEGPDGRMGEFEIKYTFGVRPLQQYLIPFEGGRLQCLLIAWDTEKKRWFRIPPYDIKGPDDWLHWTKAGQNWNAMCSECHSTHLVKGYDPDTKTYKTTWEEIDVSCEACHGPGSRHLVWAEESPGRHDKKNNFGLVVPIKKLTSVQQVELCARCHSRRVQLGIYDHSEKAMMDNIIPVLLSEDLYFPDGQILDEVYVYGSFVQSKKFQKGVRCSDCHNVHTAKIQKEGNDLCLRCHSKETFDTKAHHFHKKAGEKGEPIKTKTGEVLFKVGEGAECQQCHMPGRYYMGNDYRPDHSFRVPRPDLSVKLGTPNACNRCHVDQTDQWSANYFKKWYGLEQKPHYGTILAAGRKRLPEAQKDLVRLVGDQSVPVIVRATALTLLDSYPRGENVLTFQRALADEEPLIRYTAVRFFDHPDLNVRIRLVVPLLKDPVKAVRMEAAMNLTAVPRGNFNPDQKKVFDSALLEYQKFMEYMADFSAYRHNLGNMYANLGQIEMAEKKYKEAIQINYEFYPAKVNLALLYNGMKRNKEAEWLLRDVLKEHPELYEVSYSLGLLLGEEKRFEEAEIFIKRAAKGLPHRARIHYNFGLLLQSLNKWSEAETALLRALELEPNNIDFLYVLADHYIKRKDFLKAESIAKKMVTKYPSHPKGHELLRFLDKNSKR